MVLKNKKAYDNISDNIMLFIVFSIIAVWIFAGITIFYSNNIDIRSNEAEILSDKLTRTIINKIDNNENLAEDFNVYKEADLNSQIVKEYYNFKVEIYENNNLIKTIKGGNNRGFEVECELNDKKLLQCHKQSLVLGNYKINILTSSNQIGKKI